MVNVHLARRSSTTVARAFAVVCAVSWAVAVVGCASSTNDTTGSGGAQDGGADSSVDTGTAGDSGIGDANFSPDSGCTPPTCQDLGVNCGPVTDKKCGGLIQCGDCPAGEVCGAAGPNLCGTGGNPEGGCTPQTCSDLGANCGKALDGCGNLIDCGTCKTGQGCGVGGQPNVCAPNTPDGGSCTPKTCADQNIGCGPAGDGCGATLDCGGCPSGESCGGGGTPGQCGKGTVCTPLTCSGQSVNCGPAGDGCGGTLSCGSCTLPQTCGGGGKAGQCGCSGICSQVPTCPSGKTTTLSGKVFDPGGFNPLYNVLVYVPNDPSDPALKAFPIGPTCDVCGATAAGNPLVTTHTAADGSFTLSGVPVGSSIPVVIQLGRWRRVFNVNIAS